MAIKETTARIIARATTALGAPQETAPQVDAAPSIGDPVTEPEDEESELTEEEKEKEEQERIRISNLPWWQKDFIQSNGKQYRRFYGAQLLRQRAQLNLKQREAPGTITVDGEISLTDAVYDMRKDGWRVIKKRVQVLRELRAKKKEQKV